MGCLYPQLESIYAHQNRLGFLIVLLSLLGHATFDLLIFEFSKILKKFWMNGVFFFCISSLLNPCLDITKAHVWYFDLYLVIPCILKQIVAHFCVKQNDSSDIYSRCFNFVVLSLICLENSLILGRRSGYAYFRVTGNIVCFSNCCEKKLFLDFRFVWIYLYFVTFGITTV